LAGAVRALSAVPDVSVTRSSRYYRTAAIGVEDQPDFLNLVVEIVTGLGPLQLLEVAQALERDAGRVRTVRWGPRTLDVDILWYDGIFMDHDRLRLPHPRMEERRFVLEPLAELAPDLALDSGRTVRAALAGVLEQDVAVVADPTEE
jgi:2-amino-4-hydroxy-6-hydroxymethyldihydropteridine diphosphokinase